MAKYKDGAYHKSYFPVSINIDIKLIMCKYKSFIPSKLQSYVIHLYHTYLLHPVMDKIEAMIHQHFYWPDIRYSIRKEVSNCDTCQHTKQSNKNMVNYQLS